MNKILLLALMPLTLCCMNRAPEDETSREESMLERREATVARIIRAARDNDRRLRRRHEINEPAPGLERSDASDDLQSLLKKAVLQSMIKREEAAIEIEQIKLDIPELQRVERCHDVSELFKKHME